MQGVSGSNPLGSIPSDSLLCKGSFLVRRGSLGGLSGEQANSGEWMPTKGAVMAIAAWLRSAAWACAAFLCGLLLFLSPNPAWADGAPSPEAYLCDGEPLTALLVKGPMDEPAIPDPSTGPVPIGGNVVLAWRGLSLQLPRTNNAGPSSFSDGKWWWSLEDPAHPRFRLRRPFGDIQDFSCARAGS